MEEHQYVVIMAGGSGTRLWPLSRHNRPKQMLHFDDKRTLFQLAVDRLDGLVCKDHIYVVTIADQALMLQACVPEIPIENYLIEPLPRGTASVVGLAAIVIDHLDPQASMAVVTADHLIKDTAYFQSLVRSGFEVAQQGYLVTVGVQPTAPITGYGYIQCGKKLGEIGGNAFYSVVRFIEKPNLAKATGFIESGNHFWNSGMFIWTVKKVLAEIASSMPMLSRQLEIIARAYPTDNRERVLNEIWQEVEPQTIDYGIMEKANQVAVLPGTHLGWSDVGSWDSLYEAMPADGNGNVVLGANHLGIDSTSSLILSEKAERLIVTIGLNDLIVVDTGDALLICKRGDSQKVRDVVNLHLKNDKNGYI